MSESGELILVVEDDVYTCEAIRDVLAAEGYTVRCAHDGEDAICSIERHMPDAIVLDLMMPKMNGWEFLAECEKHAQWQQIPVLVLTAHNRPGPRSEVPPVEDFLAKPVDLDDLLSAVRRMVRR